MSSLGNVEVTPLASITFINFVTGDILYITGEAKTLVGAEAEALMRRQRVLTTVTTTGYTFVRDALPLRQNASTPVARSPYTPPVKFLVEETPSTSNHYFNDIYATLTEVDLLSQDIAVFRFEIQGAAVEISPGQAIALDFTDFMGPQQYAHMNASNPTSVNDDRIRTWTVSSAHVHGKTQTFELTMREKQGGLVTGALFTIARKLKESMPHVMEDCRVLGMVVRLVGVAGDFVLPPSQGLGVGRKLLFVAGGIGITPFLSMLKAVRERDEERDVVVLISTREPEVLLDLVAEAISPPSAKLKLVVHVFSSQGGTPDWYDSSAKLEKHSSRISRGFWTNGLEDTNDREVYLCGPPEFNRAIQEDSGLESARIHTEGFNY